MRKRNKRTIRLSLRQNMDQFVLLSEIEGILQYNNTSKTIKSCNKLYPDQNCNLDCMSYFLMWLHLFSIDLHWALNSLISLARSNIALLRFKTSTVKESPIESKNNNCVVDGNSCIILSAIESLFFQSNRYQREYIHWNPRNYNPVIYRTSSCFWTLANPLASSEFILYSCYLMVI